MIRLLSIFSPLLPIIFFLVFKGRNKEKRLWVIFINSWFSILFDLSYKILTEKKKAPEFELFSFYTLTEYTLIAIFFYLTLITPAFKKVIIVCSFLFYVVFPLNVIYFRNLNFDSLTFSIEAVFVVVFSIMYFYEQINDPNVTFVYGTKSFWIIIGILLYITVGLFPYIVKPFLNHKERRLLDPISYMANVLKNVLFAISFRMRPLVVKQKA